MIKLKLTQPKLTRIKTEKWNKKSRDFLLPVRGRGTVLWRCVTGWAPSWGTACALPSEATRTRWWYCKQKRKTGRCLDRKLHRKTKQQHELDATRQPEQKKKKGLWIYFGSWRATEKWRDLSVTEEQGRSLRGLLVLDCKRAQVGHVIAGETLSRPVYDLSRLQPRHDWVTTRFLWQ